MLPASPGWLQLESCADELPFGDSLEDVRSVPVGDDGVRADASGDFGGDEFGGHAADIAWACRAGGLPSDIFINLCDGGDHVACAVRVTHETVYRGEYHEALGVDECGDVGRKAVVVAHLDLVTGDGVILVDDG